MRRLVKNLRVFVLAAAASAFVFASPALAGPDGGLSVIADLNGDAGGSHDPEGLKRSKTYAYLLNGDRRSISQGSIKTIPSGWEPVAICDINGDLNADLLIQNASTAQGVRVPPERNDDRGSRDSQGGPSGWEVVGCSDINGDDKSDLMIQNTSTRKVFAYLLDGTSVESQGTIKTVPVGLGGRWLLGSHRG